ncbi:helix-turn-helix transcriptional regulator [Mycobacteroides abscessus]|uniref:helix-turn-helix transcriptional regulator n=1 Tax=Mycobacteroides abscessus TaxID=36809 RepID=UPI0018E4B66A
MERKEDVEMRQWLLDIRKGFELTQEQVAEKAEIARQTYSMIETGERNPSVKNAKKIANALDFEWTLFFDEQCHDSQNEDSICQTS